MMAALSGVQGRDLDGLRAVAVGLVVLDHAELPVGNIAGVAGVTAFFVLSGFLITTLLLRERELTGRIDVRAFYARRIRRLLPAFGVMILVVAGLGLAGHWASDWPLSVATGSLYVGNWWSALGLPSELPAAHAWSLNIEEQFYLVWPLLLIVGSRRGLLTMCAIGVIGAVVLRTVTPEAFAAHSTITRMDGLLLGCALALVGVRWHAWLGALGLIILGVAAYGANWTPGLFYAFGPNVPSAALLAAVGTTLIVGSRVRALDVLAPIGKRAYGIYLWSWPLTILVGGLLAIPLTLVAAELSYRSSRRRSADPGRAVPGSSRPPRPRSPREPRIGAMPNGASAPLRRRCQGRSIRRGWCHVSTTTGAHRGGVGWPIPQFATLQATLRHARNPAVSY